MTSDFDVTKVAILFLEKAHGVYYSFWSFQFSKCIENVDFNGYILLNNYQNNHVDEKSGRLCLCMNDSQVELLAVESSQKPVFFTKLKAIKYTSFC